MNATSFVAFLLTFSPGDATPPPAEYVAKLTSAAPTAEAQFKLAEWARRQGMKDVAEGHFRAAVFINPNFAPAQKSLGRTLKGGIWETREERKNRLERELGKNAQLQTWRSRLKDQGIAEAVRARTLNEAAATAIEEYAANDRGRSLDAVRAFAASEHGAATWGIIRQAVASPFVEVRAKAAMALRDRNPDTYLATLVEFTRPQMEGRSVVLGVGEIWRWREGDVRITAIPARPTLQSAASSGPQGPSLEERYANLERLKSNAAVALETATGLKLGNDFSKWRQVLPQISDAAVDDKPRPTTEMITYYQPEAVVIGTKVVLPPAMIADS
jgi:hypothetical protein